MTDSSILSDEHVAKLLAKDAQDLARRRQESAIYQPPSKRPAEHGWRLNTRFLKNVIRDAQQHNANLASNGSRHSRSPGTQESSRRRRSSPHGTRAEDLFSSKRRRTRALSRSPRHSTSPSSDQRRSRRHGDDDSSRRESRRHRHRDRSQEDNERRSSKRHRRHYHRDDSRERRHYRSRSRSPKRTSHDLSEPRRKRRSHDSLPKKRRDQKSDNDTANESDPLNEIIGPRPAAAEPPVRRRGRGVSRMDSGIDERFSAHYDPALDVQPEEDDGSDWEQALEAMRDRQRWKQQGAERLRTAGFSEDQISKWKRRDNPAGEDWEEEVRWKKKGEDREWDRGKVVTEDGSIATKLEW